MSVTEILRFFLPNCRKKIKKETFGLKLLPKAATLLQKSKPHFKKKNIIIII